MAVRYTRYESKGIGARFSLPSSAGQTAVVNSYNQMSSMLDSMAKTFYGEAVKEKKIEGAEYGALNAPTDEQLENAKANNIDLDLVGDKSTVFGRSARMAVLEATSDKLTVLAQKKMANIIMRGSYTNETPDEISIKLDSVIAGYVGSLEKESPITALKLKAQLGINANSRYVAYSKKFITDTKARAVVEYVKGVDIFINEELPLYIKNGHTITKTLDDDRTIGVVTLATTKKVIDTYINNTLRKAPANLDKTLAESIPKKIRERVLVIAENIISDNIFKEKNAEEIYTNILAGDIKKLPMEIQSALSVLEGSDKIKALGWVRDAINKKEAYKTKQIKNAEVYRNESIRIIEFNINKTLSNPDSTDRLNLFKLEVAKLAKIDPAKAKEYEGFYKSYTVENEDGGSIEEKTTNLKSDTTLVNTIEYELSSLNPRITVKQLNKSLLKGKLSFPDFTKYSEKVRLRNDKSFSLALKDARTFLKVPDTPFISMGNETAPSILARQTYNKIENAMMRARRNDTNFNAQDWMATNLESYANPDLKADDRKRIDITVLAESYVSEEQITLNIGRATDKEYKDKLIKDKEIIQQYLFDNSDVTINLWKPFNHAGDNS